MCYAQEGGTGAEESDKVLYELGEARRWGGGRGGSSLEPTLAVNDG